MKDIKEPVSIAYLYDNGGVLDLNDELISKLDYINYSFALIKDGKVYINSNQKNNLDKVLNYKKLGVKVVLSIGGWGAGGFSEAVSSLETRIAFINSILELIDKYNFDGIDLDWEYPTVSFSGIASSSNDEENFVFLCKELKEKFSNLNKELILSIAVPCNDKYYNYEKLNEYVDYVNIMSYDMSIASKKAKHHCNLYDNESIGSFSSADTAVRLISKYIPNSKIVIGIAFYGRYGLYDGKEFKLGDNLSEAQGPTFPYKDIKKMVENGVEVLWDDIAKAPYIISGGKFITFDNERSIKEKSQYVINKGLGGLMFWQLGAQETDKLVDAINRFIKG